MLGLALPIAGGSLTATTNAGTCAGGDIKWGNIVIPLNRICTTIANCVKGETCPIPDPPKGLGGLVGGSK